MTTLDDRPAQAPASVLDHDAAWRSLVVIWPGHGDVEIGPVTAANHAMALVVADLINANPALRSYVCQQLAELPDVAGCRVLPLAALGDEVQMTMTHGIHPWGDEAR